MPAQVRRALVAGWANAVPLEATALYARWWQLETWLREVVYVERRAKWGLHWADTLADSAATREARDQAQRHMMTPDAQARLAYLDISDLFNKILKDWDLFEQVLFDGKDVWAGRVVELSKIRHRIGHCRRPHPDDLVRLEQTLRDLEPGAFESVASYNRQWEPDKSLDDPIVEAWVREGHPDARRLVRHADHTRDIRFVMRYSRRPWAKPLADGSPISGTEGYLWHACWYLIGSALPPRRWWEDTQLDVARDLIVFAGFATRSALEVTFPAVDDSERIADAIGSCFDAVMLNESAAVWRSHRAESYEDMFAAHRDLDVRVQVGTTSTIVDDSTKPISLFGA